MIPVFGWSMYPSIPPWSVVVVEPFSYRDLRAGDVIVYQSGHGSLIVHRLVSQKPRGWVAKGDNNPTADQELVTEWNFFGRVKVVDLP